MTTSLDTKGEKRTKERMSRPSCFGSSKVSENRDGFYSGKCLTCRFEDECIGVYLGSLGGEK